MNKKSHNVDVWQSIQTSEISLGCISIDTAAVGGRGVAVNIEPTSEGSKKVGITQNVECSIIQLFIGLAPCPIVELVRRGRVDVVHTSLVGDVQHRHSPRLGCSPSQFCYQIQSCVVIWVHFVC